MDINALLCFHNPTHFINVFLRCILMFCYPLLSFQTWLRKIAFRFSCTIYPAGGIYS